MSILYFELILFIISLSLASLFAFLETAFTGLRLFKIKELSQAKGKYALLFKVWEKNPQRILITILIANNFAHVLSSVLIAEIMDKLFGGFGVMIGVFLATIVILIFGEIIPKTIAKANSDKIFDFALFIVSFLYKIFYPIVSMLINVANFIFKYFGKKSILESSSDDITEKELQFLIGYSDKKGLINSEKSEMLQNIFDLGSTLVEEIMVPKNDMVIVDENISMDDVLKYFSKYGYSRLPVYSGKEDNIIGIIYQKDVFSLLPVKKDVSIKELIRPVLFIPETKRINQLLTEFLNKRMHLAIVIDEYGATSGLVTLEDVLEEIVGEIRDEHEIIESQVVKINDNSWLVNARIPLEELSHLLKIEIESQDSNTLAGFLLEKFQRFPRKNENYSYKDYVFKVKQLSNRRIVQVLITKN